MNVRRVIVIAVVAFCAMAMVGCAAAGSSSAASSSASSAASSSAASSSTATSSTTPSSGTSFDPTTFDPSAVPTADSVLPESEWGTLMAREGDKAIEFGRRVQDELPVKAHAEYDGEGGGTPIEFTDPAQIRALFNALASANADTEATMVRTDDYTQFWFEFADGTGYNFFFDSLAVEVQEDGKYKAYAVEGGDDLYWFAYAAMKHSGMA